MFVALDCPPAGSRRCENFCPLWSCWSRAGCEKRVGAVGNWLRVGMSCCGLSVVLLVVVVVVVVKVAESLKAQRVGHCKNWH